MKISIRKRLGHLVSYHPVGPYGPLLLFIGATLLTGLLIIVGYAWTIKFAVDFVPFLGLGAVVGIIGMALLYRWKKYKGSDVSVYEKGFSHVAFGKQFSYLWEDVHYVTQRTERGGYNGITTPPRTAIKVHLLNGKKLRFGETYRGVEELSRNLQQQAMKAQVPKTIDQIEAGEIISFGGLKVEKQGVSRLFRRLPWKDIDSVTWEREYLVIRNKGRSLAWGKPYVFKIRNVYALLAIFAHFGVSTNIRGWRGQNKVS